jgi:cellulose synthase/poly-beta-1,6-N-acetylglucosamine synthase-like glycosyltransferase
MSDISRSPGPLRAAVLIPARNEEEALPGLLAALAASNVEGLETVVVVDNGSTRNRERGTRRRRTGGW